MSSRHSHHYMSSHRHSGHQSGNHMDYMHWGKILLGVILVLILLHILKRSLFTYEAYKTPALKSLKRREKYGYQSFNGKFDSKEGIAYAKNNKINKGEHFEYESFGADRTSLVPIGKEGFNNDFDTKDIKYNLYEDYPTYVPSNAPNFAPIDGYASMA